MKKSACWFCSKEMNPGKSDTRIVHLHMKLEQRGIGGGLIQIQYTPKKDGNWETAPEDGSQENP